MGSKKSKLPAATQESRGPEEDPVFERYQARRRNGSMRVREAAVLPFGMRVEEDRYPELVAGMLGHLASVLRELDDQEVDIMLLRDDTRAALARLQAA
jgi:hypothetical protein